MKILRGRSWITNLQIILGAELQEALEAGAGMFWSLSFVAMWQQQGQADRARDLLGRLLQRFGEGVGTADVNAASSLLAELKSANAPRPAA